MTGEGGQLVAAPPSRRSSLSLRFCARLPLPKASRNPLNSNFLFGQGNCSNFSAQLRGCSSSRERAIAGGSSMERERSRL